ncbi:MAG: adenylate/guanylate cyclase domain-containing protein [Betaproteobacteria bacterium]
MHGGIVDSLSVKRRLTCILAADAVGYSGQMGRDEEGTIRVLAAHRAVIDGIIAFHEGRIVSTAGDSVLAEFSSVVEAVRCAVEIQEAIKTRNDSLPEARQMQFRVGVNLGDVVVKNGDLLGDGVNVAARLESIAEPGGVCISSSVYDQITGKLDLGFLDIGEQNLKNITRPIRAYRISGSAPPARPTPPSQAPRRPTATWIGAAAAVAVVVAAAVAWQMGWLRIGSTDGGRPATAAAPSADPQPVLPAQKAAVAADTDAKRAQTEADATRIRAHAEALKRQAESELSRTRADAEAARAAARMKTDAEAAAARVRAQAETDAARIRADAEKQAANAAQAQVVASAPRPTPSPDKAPPSADKATPAASAAAANTAFDGTWSVTVVCPVAADGAAGYRLEFVAQVTAGHLLAVHGTEGNQDSLRVAGDIRPDGSALLIARGRTGDPKYSVGRVQTGSPYGYRVGVRFEGSTGTGKRLEGRTCDLSFARR